ncbi:MAG TPA: hypothetical protein VIR56_01990 [Solimonas sp.]
MLVDTLPLREVDDVTVTQVWGQCVLCVHTNDGRISAYVLSREVAARAMVDLQWATLK